MAEAVSFDPWLLSQRGRAIALTHPTFPPSVFWVDPLDLFIPLGFP
ncbi:MAG: hypothetical protein AAF889_08745 [Cyanobacteria bacterium P01_D01_bin.73]